MQSSSSSSHLSLKFVLLLPSILLSILVFLYLAFLFYPILVFFFFLIFKLGPSLFFFSYEIYLFQVRELNQMLYLASVRSFLILSFSMISRSIYLFLSSLLNCFPIDASIIILCCITICMFHFLIFLMIVYNSGFLQQLLLLALRFFWVY